VASGEVSVEEARERVPTVVVGVDHSVAVVIEVGQHAATAWSWNERPRLGAAAAASRHTVTDAEGPAGGRKSDVGRPEVVTCRQLHGATGLGDQHMSVQC